MKKLTRRSALKYLTALVAAPAAVAKAAAVPVPDPRGAQPAQWQRWEPLTEDVTYMHVDADGVLQHGPPPPLTINRNEGRAIYAHAYTNFKTDPDQ